MAYKNIKELSVPFPHRSLIILHYRQCGKSTFIRLLQELKNMQFDFNKTNYWIRYNHEGKEDNKYGRCIVVHKLILQPELAIYAFCRKSHEYRTFKLSGILEVEQWLKDNKSTIEGMRATYKKGEF